MPAGQENHGHYYFIIVIIFTSSINYAMNYDSSVFTTGVFTWRWGTPGRWGNPPVRITSHYNLITFTYGVTLHMLPLLSGAPDLYVNRPLMWFIICLCRSSLVWRCLTCSFLHWMPFLGCWMDWWRPGSQLREFKLFCLWITRI